MDISISSCSSIHLKFSHNISALWDEAHLVIYSSLWTILYCSNIFYYYVNDFLFNLINISGLKANKSHVFLLNNEETMPFPHYLVVNSCNLDGFEWMYEILMIYEWMDEWFMGFTFRKWEFVAIRSNFIAFGENYISFPQGSKTSFLYLIERSDKSHENLIGYEYESLIMSSTNPLLQFKNLSGFLHILEAISITYPGRFEPKIASKIFYLV